MRAVLRLVVDPYCRSEALPSAALIERNTERMKYSVSFEGNETVALVQDAITTADTQGATPSAFETYST